MDNLEQRLQKKARLRTINLRILLVVATLSCYSNSFGAPLVFDDVKWIVHDRAIRQVRPESLLQGGARRFVSLTLAANYAVGKHDPRGYHAVNMTIHLLAALARFELVRGTLQLPSLAQRYGSSAANLALAVALLWSVHPLQTQSVTYIIQRFESMMGLFYLLCLLAVLRSSQSNNPWIWNVIAILACWVGMMSKEVMATAPLVVLLYDRIFLASSWRELFRRRWIVYAGFLPAMAWLAHSVAPSFNASRPSSIGFGVRGLTSWEYFSTQPQVILHYLRVAFWPDVLCIDYRWPVARAIGEILLPGAVIVGLLAASLWLVWKRPRVGFFGLSFFLILAPTSSFVPIRDLAFEHRMYLPLACVVALLVIGVDSLLRRLPRMSALGPALLMIVAAALGIKTYHRNEDYLHPIQLWQKVLEVNPDDIRAWHNLAFNYHLRHRHDEAIEAYRVVLKNNPDHERSHYNLASLLTAENRLNEAIAHYRKALAILPRFPLAHIGYGEALMKQNKLDGAEKHFHQALAIDPEHERAYLRLGETRFLQGRDHEAQAMLRRALELAADYAHANRVLAWIYAVSSDPSIRDGRRAEEFARLALSQARQQFGDDAPGARFYDSLAAALARQGKFPEATKTARKALELAVDAREQDLIPKIEARIARYDAGRAYEVSRE